MNDNFLLEAIWVLCTYGIAFTVSGLVISSVLVLWGSRRAKLWARIAFLGGAIILLWIALILGIENGYHAWQSIPNPPKEAFSDAGGPFTILFLGWFPSLVILGIEHLLLTLCWRSFCSKKPTPPPESISNTD